MNELLHIFELSDENDTISKKDIIHKLNNLFKKKTNISHYTLFLHQKLNEDSIKLYDSHKERMTIISDLWNKEKDFYLNDKEWYDKRLEIYLTTRK